MIKTNSLKKIYPFVLAAISPLVSQGREVVHFTMENNGDKVTETVSGKTYPITSIRSAENVKGARGKGLRFDGYTTYIDAPLEEVLPSGSKKMTASLWCAIETYPIVEIDVNTTEQVAIASCLDEKSRTGFGFFVGCDGKYSFRTFAGGWPLELKVETPLPQFSWINLTAVIDSESRTAVLYNNGKEVASGKFNGDIMVGNSVLRIGRSLNERFSGPFCLTSFNGIIDDITIWDESLSQTTVSSWEAENEAQLTIPASRFADDPLRPVFHGMPGANWTNETHGLTYSNGRYHLFFQKNGNGPYMSRLHWGHLSSENLYNWREEPVALTPGTPFDIKGCWSGCVFTDNELTLGKPSIIYTGVDYGRAVIAQADPGDENLLSWTKRTEPIINGRPEGLSDDFRDPYFFRANNNAYIIVGSNKNGIGTTTLHCYNPSTRSWSNDGRTFFSGSNSSTAGTFWEMPNVTQMGDKWLFTTTPLNTSKGVATLFWVGAINADGTFKPARLVPANVELPGFSRDGYGLLSPTIYQYEGKTIALGIVPDKLPSGANYNLGYAHTYSLPREWSLDTDGNLCQKPFSGLSGMRETNGFSKEEFILNGSLDMEGINGRAIELCGEFTVGEGKCGFNLLEDDSSAVKVYYNGASNEIIVDCREVSRIKNDEGVFDGFYRSSLPKQLAKGSIVKLNVFFDHSILDIFVNDTWSSSVRIFANAKTREDVSVFAENPTDVRSAKGWILNPGKNGTGVDFISSVSERVELSTEKGNLKYNKVTTPARLTIYNLTGEKVLETKVENESGYIAAALTGLHIIAMDTPEGLTTRKILF